MRHGDLSNERESSIAFRVDDFLVHGKSGSFVSRFLSTEKYELNQVAFRMAKSILYRTPYTLDLVVSKGYWNERLESFLEDNDLYWSKIHVVSSELEVEVMLSTGDVSYYVDAEGERFDRVKNNHCLTLSEINKMIQIAGRV